MSQHYVIIALGANTDSEKNIERANGKISTILNNIRLSNTLWTAPIGIKSNRFLNQVITGQTTLSLQELEVCLKEIEKAQGRTEEESRKGIIRIDIDILQFDSETLHIEDWSRDYIKKLMKEIRE